MDIQGGDEQSNMISDCIDATLYAKKLTKNLISYSKDGPSIRQVFDLFSTIRLATEKVLTDSEIELEIGFPKDKCKMNADEKQLAQVIQNVVSNAKQAMGGKGKITICAEFLSLPEDANLWLKPGKYVKIDIKDNGCGIPKDILQSIFDPYFSNNTSPKRLGLGLAIARSVIDRHDGIISCKSKPYIGSTFSIFLPLNLNSSTLRTDDYSTFPIQKSSNILIMDDDERVRRLLINSLVKIGHNVTAAASGEEALQYVKKGDIDFDMVMLDLTVIDGMSGTETMHEMQKIQPDLRSIVMSGYVHSPVMKDYEEYGFDEALKKPFTISELAKLVHLCLLK